jgi:hypothetical protein
MVRAERNVRVHAHVCFCRIFYAPALTWLSSLALQISDASEQQSGCENHISHVPPLSTALVICQALLLEEWWLEARM